MIHEYETALLAGGCFWGMEDIIRKIPGVLDTEVVYTGGDIPNPTYEQVKTGKTGHAEAVLIKFDNQKLKYETLLDFFFRMHDPTTINRQGNDIGTQYRSSIFYFTDNQKQVALAKIIQIDSLKKWKAKVVTQVIKATAYYKAEDYHQDYLEKNPGGYTCHFLRD